ncbi:MAG TPA: rRNA maturation RNase YbeY [Chloroflexi bacterium]|nr:rRNA maturation RNase YbeY [Chloroflexota bacterium]
MNVELPLSYLIEVQIDQQFDDQLASRPLRQTAQAVLEHQQVPGPCELAVVVSDDAALYELNRRHRGVNAPTDVLAFPDDTRGPFVGAPGMPRYLGDVVISFQRAEVQASEAGHDTLAEIHLLVVHGILHLLGYDDTTEQQRARMWAVQAEILQSLGIQAHPPARSQCTDRTS